MKALYLLLLVGLLSACQSAGTVAPATAPSSSTLAAFTPTQRPTRQAAPTNQATPTVSVATQAISTQPVPHSPTAPPQCVQIGYDDYAQIELIGAEGPRVLIDVYDPGRLSAPANKNDILLTTHTHWDHFQAEFQADFPGEQLFAQSGVLGREGITIRGIASAHNDGERLKDEGGSNTIYLIESSGLRIAHFGDIGQSALTEEQIEILLPVDIAIIQIANSYSDMNAANQKGIHLIEQIGPRWAIVTHANLETAALAVAQWPGWYSAEPVLTFCRPNLPVETQILFLGEWAVKLPPYLDLKPWP